MARGNGGAQTLTARPSHAGHVIPASGRLLRARKQQPEGVLDIRLTDARMMKATEHKCTRLRNVRPRYLRELVSWSAAPGGLLKVAQVAWRPAAPDKLGDDVLSVPMELPN